jgi:hypothetical protein
MNADKVLADSMVSLTIESGDTSKERVERMSFFTLRFTHRKNERNGF